MRHCTQCGTAAGTEHAFCTRCGAHLGPPAEPSAPVSAAGSGPRLSPAADPPAPAASGPYRDSGPESPTAAWAPSEPVGSAPQAPAPSRQASAPADTGGESASSWLSPYAGTGQAGPQADFQLPGRRQGRRIGTIAAAAAIVLVLGGGAAVGWKLLGHNTVRHTAGPQVSAGTVRPRPASTSAAAPPGTASQPTPASGSPDTGQATVGVAPAASQQTSAPQVAAFLDAYFQAINTRDYSSYISLYQPELRQTLQQFQNGYRSTQDSGAVLTDVTPTAFGLAAAVSFTSHQQPADSATGTSCTSWDITLYLEPHGGTYWIVRAPADYHAHYQAC